ncbi:MAG: N-acetylmuramoyl-L-alanine amidase CwlD [Clostridia bacterium]|nr:N-acetylmuramoyl-L-alanine amidase CwlD [Clostridia bacterium]
MVIFVKKQIFNNAVFLLALLMASISFFCGSNNFKPVMSPYVSGKVIIIDAGHGSPDGGATGFSGSKEKDLNLLVSKSLGNLFMQSGARVIYTRQTDESIYDSDDASIKSKKQSDMKNRKKIRDESEADLFISIHMNKFPESKYKGAQVFYNNSHNDNKSLADLIQKELKNIADSSNNRSPKDSKNDIFILNGSKIPSVLVECGFISNPEEEKKLLTKAYRDKLAYAIYSGVLKYFTNT